MRHTLLLSDQRFINFDWLLPFWLLFYRHTYFRWYHGAISRREAEEILRSQVEGSYLVRSVDTSRQEYALSLKYGNCTF